MVPSSSHVGSTKIFFTVRLSGSLVPNTGHASGSTLRTYTIALHSYSVTRPSVLSAVILPHIPLPTLLQLQQRSQ